MRLTRKQKEGYEKSKAIAYSYFKSGIENIALYDIIHGLNEYAVIQCIEHSNQELFPIKAKKIYYTLKGNPFILVGGFRVHLNTFIRTNI